ncbi:DUF2202 domain-containing protein [Thiomicrorhabdus sp. zzn3]|uniref:DUF2202 domain-containing protein n=1 Tax=Thiomicrorhabdus sp. zzn3 TaxID=3039775 RepID=UPI002436A813|nr:DUF2202 domain-containing protein [Thiomicrorhabdus sp. zzn3]MDG6777955.1 DUF2202 domain-containing protein [Thiomicrorhabdus sp. zzn3]
MINTILKTTAVTLAAFSFAVAAPVEAGGKGGKLGNGGNSGSNSSQTQTVTETSSQLTVFESTSLKFMREEEKLARDVYLTLYERWGVPIFANIAESEQQHTNTIAALLAKYGIEDPVKDDSVGAFTDPAFSELFTALVNLGSQSYEAALMVGTEIEELDIADLNEQINVINKQDIVNAYNNLLKGSRNHLRSFYSLVVEGGFEYTPKHITQEEFDAIVNSEMETGNIN